MFVYILRNQITNPWGRGKGGYGSSFSRDSVAEGMQSFLAMEASVKKQRLPVLLFHGCAVGRNGFSLIVSWYKHIPTTVRMWVADEIKATKPL